MILALDVETYANYFLVVLTTEDGKSKRFEIFNNDATGFNAPLLTKILKDDSVEKVTFNGTHYDMPVLTAALHGFNTRFLKKLSDEIINKNMKAWNIYKQFNLNEIATNHVDLIEVAPGMSSLKIYGGRLHSDKLQDLPIEPDAVIKEDQLPLMRRYCKNDTLVTHHLRRALSKQITLREQMSDQYGLDLRSKSDAQIAEAVLKAEFERITGFSPQKMKLEHDRFNYKPPSYIEFKTEQLQDALDTICQSEMVIKPDTGHVQMPKAIENLKIKIGETSYKIGIGGLHSQESEVCHKEDDEHLIIDRDVASYYPNLMLNMGMSPGSFGNYFQDVYRNILGTRLRAKREGNKVVADSLKIVLNGTFGKTSNRYSRLYAPEMMIRTTLTGQLSLLMLIEACELIGVSVVSANTDGIVMKCPRTKKETLDKLIEAWEKRTNLETEETVYKALYSRDVNNYIAVKPDGSTKAKGAYAPVSLSKNPANEICNEAAALYCASGKDYAQHIRECSDIRKFVTVRTVNGGALKDGELLGKAIRWYCSTETDTPIVYAKNGNLVPKSDGAKPIMDLPDELPDDVDYEWYIAETKDILMSIGAMERPQYEKVPRRNSKAWKALVASGDIYEDRKGKWQWVNPDQHLIHGHSAS